MKGECGFFHASEVRNTRLEFLEQQLKAMVHSLLIPTIIFWRDYQGRMNFFLCLLVLRTSVISEKDLLA